MGRKPKLGLEREVYIGLIDVPQFVDETRVSGDYNNEFLGLIMDFDSLGREQVAKSTRKHPMKTYQERYSSIIYKNVVTDENRWRVDALNTLTSWVNGPMLDADNFTDDGFKTIINIGHSLIFGPGKKPYYS